MSARAGFDSWERAVREHRAALRHCCDVIAAAPEEAWIRRPHPDGWSPAEIVEHLSLAYEVGLQELREDRPVRLKGAPWVRALSRWLLLPHMLFHRTFPVRVRSPREIRPEQFPNTPPEGIARLRALGERFDAELAEARARGAGRLTHPYFGRLSAARGLRFMALHVEHHTKQIEERLRAGTGLR